MGYASLESLRIGLFSFLRNLGELKLQDLCCAMVEGLRGRRADAAMTILGVVPVEEAPVMWPGGLDRSEALEEVRPALQGLELRFLFAISDVWSAVGAR